MAAGFQKSEQVEKQERASETEPGLSEAAFHGHPSEHRRAGSARQPAFSRGTGEKEKLGATTPTRGMLMEARG